MSDNTLVFFIACLMPIAIVIVQTISSMNKDKLRAHILVKAIESSDSIDTKKLAQALQKPKRTPLEVLNRRLLLGCIFTLSALFFGMVYIFFLSNMDSEGGVLLSLLIAACLAIGLGFLITYFITRSQIDLVGKNDNSLDGLNSENEISSNTGKSEN